MTVHAQYVKDLSFENPNAPISLQNTSSPPTVQIQIDVKTAPINDQLIEVSLDLSVQAKQESQIVFLVELVYAGLFEVTADAGELARQYIGIEAPNFLFPFARAIVAEITRDGGFPPLLINPVDFARLYQQQQDAAAADTAGTA